MAATDSSFDIVSRVDLPELENAVNQARKEIDNRFDFKGTGSRLEGGSDSVSVYSSDEYHLKSIIEVLESKLVRRGVPLKALAWDRITDGPKGSVRREAKILQGIDQELYDCAYVEGANKGKILFFITIPLMKPIILFSLILSFIGGIQIFDEPYILLPWTGPLGGTNYAGLVLARYLHYRAFSRWHFGYGSAIAYCIVFLIALLSALNTRLFRSEKP